MATGDLEDDWEAVTVTVDWEEPTTVESAPSANSLLEQFDQCVVGHGIAKEALVAALRKHLGPKGGRGRPPRMLLMGPLGVGKTTLLECMLYASDLPSVTIGFADVVNGSEADVPRLLSPLLSLHGTTPSGIVFLDDLEQLAVPPPGSPHTFDGGRMQLDWLPVLNGVELTAPTSRPLACDQFLVCGAVTVEEPIKQTASQTELRKTLEASVPFDPDFVDAFDMLIPFERLSAAQMAKSFTLARSPFARARRVISSLGGSFHCDAGSVEALARSCAMSPVGGWVANRVIDRLLEQVLRSPDPAKPWHLRPS